MPFPVKFGYRCIGAKLIPCPSGSGLQLCNNTTGASTGAPRCNNLGGKCKGAAPGTGNADNCYPNHIWTDTLKSGSSYWGPNLNNGVINLTNACNTGYCPSTLAFSVRCVLGFEKREPVFLRSKR